MPVEIRNELARLLTARPDDLSVQVAATIAAIVENKTDALGASVKRLTDLIDKTPLEPLAEGTRANSRQRAEAAKQLPLWLIARMS